ncbi:hypothetical protein [Actinomyces sp.]|uniref:hypothetical protein n=1 Tax=Actinomyces sp. TaxID=29317 RepID=UPI0026DAFCE1|nr:hypothetical protein [Actinomyces sp.]MDO4899441.1 hypothetical protein [Actinomyces sp.]
MERSRLLVAGSVPEGSVLAGRVSVWLDAVARVMEAEGLRADHQATGRAVARALVAWVDGRSRTTRVTNAQVAAGAAEVGVVVSVRTVQRWLRRFEAWGLLGLVAGGRSARWAPRVRVEDGHGGVELVRRNEAAVRSLCVPRRLVDRLGCGSRCHPYPLSGMVSPRTRARGSDRGGDVVPLRGAAFLGAPAPRPPEQPAHLPADRRPAWWSARATRAGEEAVLALARRVQDRLVVLRGCSDRYVMRVIRPFWDAGWGLSDLVGAVDRRPDGSAWPHSGARGVREPARWLAYRLMAWLDEAGEPLPAPSQVRRREHERVLAERARLEAARRARARAVAAERERLGGVGPAQAKAARVAAELAGRSRRYWRRSWSAGSWTGVTGPADGASGGDAR